MAKPPISWPQNESEVALLIEQRNRLRGRLREAEALLAEFLSVPIDLDLGPLADRVRRFLRDRGGS